MKRLVSIDALRGLVMIIMTLDHVRDYFYYGSFFRDPLNPATTTPLLYLTRWITHFCAPAFVFLAGISAFLYAQKRGDRGKSSLHFLKRGGLLLLLELTVVNFAWTFDFSASFRMLQVIWAIGIAMMVLSLFIFAPGPLALFSGVVILLTHNLIGSYSGTIEWLNLLGRFLLDGGTIVRESGSMINFTYPVLPWIGIILCGYGSGILFSSKYTPDFRKKILISTGLFLFILFIVLRILGLYGDPEPWNGSVYSFWDTEKYPPSLQFSLMTLGPILIALGLLEGRYTAYVKVMAEYGRQPLIYYIAHLYIIHFLAMALLALRGKDWRQMILTAETFRYALLSDYGYNLSAVYLIWAGVCLMLYPLCRRLNQPAIPKRLK